MLLATAALLVAGSLAPVALVAVAQSAAPQLTAPADGTVVDGLPLFVWTLPDAPAGATARLEVAAGPGFDQLIVAVETVEASYQQIQALDPTLTYRWRVGLLDPAGSATWSEPWTFTLSPPVEEPTATPESTETPEPTATPEPTETAISTEVPPTATLTANPTATETPTATDSAAPALTATPTQTQTSAATGAATPTVTGTGTGVSGQAINGTRTPTRTPTPRPTATRAASPAGAIPPSKLSGALPVSSGLPVSGAARSRGSSSSNLLLDRNLATLWTSPSTTPAEASVTVKLDRSRSIGKIRWVWGLRYHGDRVRIEVSRDQVTWTLVATVANAPTGQWQTLEVNVYTKYVRFRFENPNRDAWVGGLAEVEVYAGPRVTPTPSPTATPSPAPVIAPQPDGIIANPSFERGSAAWHVEPGAGVVDGVARGGTRAIRLAQDGGYAGQRVALGADRVYELSGWGMLEGTSYDVGNIGVLFYDRDGVRLRTLEPGMLPFTTTAFTRETLRFAVPVSVAAVTVAVYKVVGGARLYVDDLALRAVSGGVGPSSQLVTCQRLMMPGYFDPATGLWDQALASAPGLDIAVFNPESGPDVSLQPAYVDKVARARAAGVRPFAYVYTAYGARPIADVLRDIDTYAAWYGIADIFLDNGATSYAYVPYYRTVMDHIHTAGGIAVVNYGWWPHPAYMEFTDIANIFEDSAAVYETGYVRPSWILDYPADRFSHIVYATPLDRMDEVIALSRERNAGHVWISDDTGQTLYKTLPTYWPAINQAVRQGC